MSPASAPMGWHYVQLGQVLVVAAVSFGGFIVFEVLKKDDATIPRSVILNRTAGLCLVYAFCSSAAFNVIDYFVSRLA